VRIADLLLPAALSAGLATQAAAAELVPLGQYTWREDGSAFGGFSGLVMAPGGASFYAVSDEGELFHATVLRGAANRIERIATDWHSRLIDNNGKPVAGFTADAEALAPARDGGLYVAYESYARITEIHPPDLHPTALHAYQRFRDLWSNESFEGVAERPGGGLIVVSEKPDGSEGAYPTFLGDGHGTAMAWRPGPGIPGADGGFDASDAAFGSDGRFYLLERRVSLGGFATRIRRFGWQDGAFGASETLLETASGALDNMEGMSLWTDAAGRTVISLISDDNFLFLQRTLVAEYEVKEAQ
jgi:hypothetical protein